MIVYNDNSLDRLMINEEAGIALRKQLISKNEYDTIAAAHAVELYRPNIFIRIGLFLGYSCHRTDELWIAGTGNS